MKEESREGRTPGAERGRSPSGDPGVDAPSGEPLGPPGGSETPAGSEQTGAPRLCGPRKGRRLRKRSDEPARPRIASPEQRLLVLDTWQRSGLPAADFAEIVGISKHTLYKWKKRFEESGPEGLIDRPRKGLRQSRLPDITRRTILMIKQANPDYGCERISAMMARGPALPASPGAVAKVLHDAGYDLVEEPTRPHRDHVRFFERSKPNELWQTDIFTFMLKRQNRRVYLVAFMDDYSRYILGYGLHASQSTALVLEVLRAAIASYQTPQEILTDNGSQYVTWRGKSAFARECEKRGIKQVVATPRRPQTLGKIERFWGTLYRECVEAAVFLDMEDARRRIGHFIDHYNFQRTHQGIGNLVPADRLFGAAPEVKKALQERMAANALELARNGIPKKPFYLTGQVGGKAFSVHAEGERVIMKREGDRREEVELVPPERDEEERMPEPVCPDGSPGDSFGEVEEPAPGASPLDEGLEAMAASMTAPERKEEGHEQDED